LLDILSQNDIPLFFEENLPNVVEDEFALRLQNPLLDEYIDSIPQKKLSAVDITMRIHRNELSHVSMSLQTIIDRWFQYDTIKTLEHYEFSKIHSDLSSFIHALRYQTMNLLIISEKKIHDQFASVNLNQIVYKLMEQFASQCIQSSLTFAFEATLETPLETNESFCELLLYHLIYVATKDAYRGTVVHIRTASDVVNDKIPFLTIVFYGNHNNYDAIELDYNNFNIYIAQKLSTQLNCQLNIEQQRISHLNIPMVYIHHCVEDNFSFQLDPVMEEQVSGEYGRLQKSGLMDEVVFKNSDGFNVSKLYYARHIATPTYRVEMTLRRRQINVDSTQ
jgi:hypothetical protein